MEGGGGGGWVGSGWKKGIGSSSLAALLVIDGGLEYPILNAEITPKKKPSSQKKGGFSPSSKVSHSLSKSETPKGQKNSLLTQNIDVYAWYQRDSKVFFPITNPDSLSL